MVDADPRKLKGPSTAGRLYVTDRRGGGAAYYGGFGVVELDGHVVSEAATVRVVCPAWIRHRAIFWQRTSLRRYRWRGAAPGWVRTAVVVVARRRGLAIWAGMSGSAGVRSSIRVVGIVE